VVKVSRYRSVARECVKIRQVDYAKGWEYTGRRQVYKVEHTTPSQRYIVQEDQEKAVARATEVSSKCGRQVA
jgi:hypothetical protein